MAKREPSSSLGSKNVNERTQHYASEGFSWNLVQKELNLEDDIFLHKGIEISFESLKKIKD
jgi:hypothetical protein